MTAPTPGPVILTDTILRIDLIIETPAPSMAEFERLLCRMTRWEMLFLLKRMPADDPRWKIVHEHLYGQT